MENFARGVRLEISLYSSSAIGVFGSVLSPPVSWQLYFCFSPALPWKGRHLHNIRNSGAACVLSLKISGEGGGWAAEFWSPPRRAFHSLLTYSTAMGHKGKASGDRAPKLLPLSPSWAAQEPARAAGQPCLKCGFSSATPEQDKTFEIQIPTG